MSDVTYETILKEIRILRDDVTEALGAALSPIHMRLDRIEADYKEWARNTVTENVCQSRRDNLCTEMTHTDQKLDEFKDQVKKWFFWVVTSSIACLAGMVLSLLSFK